MTTPNALERFAAYAADFEKTYADDDWTRLEPYFRPDAVYAVGPGLIEPCTLRGRDAVLRGIKRSLDGFDRTFDSREIVPLGAPATEGRSVSVTARVVYGKAGLPPLSFELTETVVFDDDGLIVEMRDTYPAGQTDAEAWMVAHGAGLDARYA
jgi:hypothetical protein